MKILYMFALVAACHGLAVKREVREEDILPAPNVGMHIILTNGALQANWEEVKNEDANDPIIGYKLKLWELKTLKAKITRYSLVNYTGKHTVELEALPLVNANRTPKGKLTEILTSATETSAITKPLKPGATYEFRVQAFTKTREGRLSSPTRIKISKE